jgi:hypothetical protein
MNACEKLVLINIFTNLRHAIVDMLDFFPYEHFGGDSPPDCVDKWHDGVLEKLSDAEQDVVELLGDDLVPPTDVIGLVVDPSDPHVIY